MTSLTTSLQLVIEEKHPAKQLDMYLELLVDSGLVRKFGRSVRQLTRNLEDGRFSIQQLIRESPIHLPGHLGLTLLRESAYRALPKVAQRVVAPATASRETPPASPGRGSRGGDPNAGGGGGGGSGGGGGADGVGSSGVSGGVNGAAAEKPRTGPRTKVGRKPHAAWLLGECDTPPHTRHGSPVFLGRGDRGGSSSDDGIATGGSDYTDSDSESDGGGSHGSGGGGGAVREVAPSTLGGDSGLGDGQDSGVHPMEQGHDTPVFFPADKAGSGGSAAAAAAAGAGAGAGAGTTANVINDAGSSGSGGSSNRSRRRRRRRRNCGRSRRDDAESVGGILEEVSRVLAEEQGLSASTFPPIESLRLRVVKKEDGDGGEGEDSDTARATPAPAHGRGKGAARAIKMEGEGGKSADGGTTASTTASTARAALSVARVLLGNAAVAGAAAAPPIKSEAASAAGNNAAPADSGGKRRAASVEMKMKQFSDWAGKPWASLPMNGELERYMEQLYAQPSHDVNAVLAYPSWYFREYELCFPEHHRAMLTAAAAQRASATANALALGKPVYNASTGQWSGPTVATAANVAAAAAAAAAAVHKPPPQSLTAHTAAHAAKQLQPQPSAAADAIMDGVDAVGSDVDTSDHGSVDSSVSDKSNEEAVAIPVRQPRTAASAKAAAAARKAAAAALKVEREKAEAAAKATAAKEAEAAAVAAREAAAREPPLSPCSLHLPSGGVVPGSQKPPVPTTLDEARRIAADAAREAAEAAAAAAAADPAEAAAAKARGCPSGCTCPASMLAMQQRHATLVPNKLRSAAPTSYASTAYYPQGYGLPSQKGFTAAQNGGGGGGWMRNTAKSPTTRSYQFFHTDTSTVAIIGSDLNCCKEGCEHEHGAQ